MRRLTHIRGMTGFKALSVRILLKDTFLPWGGSLISVEYLASESSRSAYAPRIHFYREAAHSYPWNVWLQSVRYLHMPRWSIFPWGVSLISVEWLTSEPLLSTYASMIYFFHEAAHSFPWNDWLQSLCYPPMPRWYIFSMRRLTHIRGLTDFRAFAIHLCLDDIFFSMRRLTHIRGMTDFRAFAIHLCLDDIFFPWGGSLISVEWLTSEPLLSTYASMIYFFHETSHSYPWIDWLQSLCYPHMPRWYIFSMRRLTHIRRMSGFRTFTIHICLDDTFLPWGGSLISVECLASEPSLSTYASMIHFYHEAAHSYPWNDLL